MTALTENFFMHEVTASRIASIHGIDNSLPLDMHPTVMKVAMQMEKVRALLGNKPVIVSSWYRCKALNAHPAIGSSNRSQHVKGEAVDFICPSYGTPYEVAKLIADNFDLIKYDQLIHEIDWVHISFAVTSKPQPRGELLTITRSLKQKPGILRS